MKLYNRTKLDDAILERLLYASAKFTGIGVRTSKVVVRVTTSSRELRGHVVSRGIKYWKK